MVAPTPPKRKSDNQICMNMSVHAAQKEREEGKCGVIGEPASTLPLFTLWSLF
jgi:hypothetical protein